MAVKQLTYFLTNFAAISRKSFKAISWVLYVIVSLKMPLCIWNIRPDIVEIEGEFERKTSVIDDQNDDDDKPFTDSKALDFIEEVDDGFVVVLLLLTLKRSSSKKLLNSGARYDDCRLQVPAEVPAAVVAVEVSCIEEVRSWTNDDVDFEPLLSEVILYCSVDGDDVLRVITSLLIKEGESFDGVESAPSLKMIK